jgi:TolC family type I secretion outer membrane protein
MKRFLLIIMLSGLAAGSTGRCAAEESSAAVEPESMTLEQCLALALQQNPDILKAQEELRRTFGVIVEARAEALPKVQATGYITRIDDDFIDTFPGAPVVANNQKNPWEVGVEVSQLVYSGGRVNAALRAARISEEIAKRQFQRAAADTVLNVRTAFYRIQLAQAQVNVREQSIKLLEQQLKDVQHRFEAGTVPRFNVLRAEVELANARPPLIRAQNDLRLGREQLVRLLAIDEQPRTEFTPIRFQGALQYEPRKVEMADAIRQALERRPELKLVEQQAALRHEDIAAARSGYHPELSLFAGYGVRNTRFGEQIDDAFHGWTVGARASWNIFDGMLTRGKIKQAEAELGRAEIEQDDTRRAIELEVRQAYSDYVQALELLEAQKKTVEQAEESLRLADARFKAGSGTQLDVLSAQTALTEARSNEVVALHDYNVALAKLERATGATVRQDP